MYSAYFIVKYFDNEDREEHGILTNVKDFADAMNKVENEYGELLYEVNLKLYDSPIITFSSDDATTILNILKEHSFGL